MFGLILPLATRIVGERFAKLASRAFVVLLIAAAIGAAVWWFNDTVEDARIDGVKAGVTAERVEAQGKALENVQTANDTRADVRDERSRAAYDECVRSARNAANCERFLPE